MLAVTRGLLVSQHHHRPSSSFHRQSTDLPQAARTSKHPSIMDSYSLWLIPRAGSLFDTLDAEIRSMAAMHDAPIFAPHVTLLGGIEGEEQDVCTTAADLASELVPYEVQLEPAGTGSIFHQCVFLRCASTPAVMDAAWLARQRFGMPQAAYMPHLSLLYSNCSDNMRQQLAHDVNARWFVGADEPGAPSCALPARAFTADTVSVWRTCAEDQTLSSWEQVAAFAMTG